MHRISNPICHVISLATALTRLAYAPRESPCPCMRRDTCTACSHWRTSSCSAHDDAIRDTPCLSFPRRYCTSNNGHLQQRDRQAHWLIRSGPTLSQESPSQTCLCHLHRKQRKQRERVLEGRELSTSSLNNTNLQPQRRTSRCWDSFRASWRECIGFLIRRSEVRILPGVPSSFERPFQIGFASEPQGKPEANLRAGCD